MTIQKASALTFGFVGALALGAFVGSSVATDRAARAAAEAPAPVSIVAPAPAAPAPTAVPRLTTPREVALARTSAMSPSTPALQQRMTRVLNRGTNMSIAAQGFSNAEQFATVAHAARNTQVPFILLKHRVLNEGKSLQVAIRASKPDVDAGLEVALARAEARSVLASLTNQM